MLLNLLPAYPFDGGPIFRSMLWPALGRRTARVVTGRAGMIVARADRRRGACLVRRTGVETLRLGEVAADDAWASFCSSAPGRTW